MGLHEQRALALRGDPGLFSVLGKIGGAVIRNVVPGGSAALDAVGAARNILQRGPGSARPPVALPTFRGPGRIASPGPTVTDLFTPSQTAVGRQIAMSMGPATTDGCPKGFHLNKSGYWTSGGFVAPRSRCVRNRRRNVSNGPANQRALRRLVAWDKSDRKRRKALKAIAR